MLELLTSDYFWWYCISSEFAFVMQRVSRYGLPFSITEFYPIFSTIFFVANWIFLVVALFCATHWWYVIIMLIGQFIFGFVFSGITQLLFSFIGVKPQALEIGESFLSLFICPMAIVVMYIDLL